MIALTGVFQDLTQTGAFFSAEVFYVKEDGTLEKIEEVTRRNSR